MPPGTEAGGASTYGPPGEPGGGGSNSPGQGPPGGGGGGNCGPGCFEYPLNSGNCICPPGGGGGGQGGGQGGGGGQPGQCPPGQVWRTDSHMGIPGPGCEPPDWRSQQGIETCTDFETTCPPGQERWCDFDTATFKCAPGGSGGHGGGGGGKPPGGSGSGKLPLDPGLLQSDLIWKAILARLNGETRYTPQVMSSLLGGLKTTAETQGQNSLEASNDDLASRGIARSGVAAAAARDITNNTANQVLQGKNAILKAKIDADYQDKSEAIKEAMDWLNSLRDYTARMAATQAQKDAAFANIALGYARLEQEMKMMREQYAQQLQWWQITNGANAPMPF